MPPRHGKSELLGRYLPAWYLGLFPDRNVIYASYNAQQARHYGQLARDVFARCARRYFGLRVSPTARAAHRWRIAGREGGMYAQGVQGSLTGKGAHLMIIDDPIKNEAEAASRYKRDALWEWFHATAMTRLEPGGAVIVNMTRWHDDDLVGRLLQSPQAGDWRVLSFPAICEEPDALGRQVGDPLWPERYPLEDVVHQRERKQGLLSMRAGMPRRVWESLYQQHPMRQVNYLWPEHYFTRDDLWFDDWPKTEMLRVMALDPALGHDRQRGDYAAFVMLAIEPGGRLWVEAELLRCPMTELVHEGLRIIRAFRPQRLRIETNHFQAVLYDHFASAIDAAGVVGCRLESVVHHEPKGVRIERLDGVLAEKMIRFRDTSGTRLLVEQLKDFPAAAHDDGPDALEMAARAAADMLETDPWERTSRFHT